MRTCCKLRLRVYTCNLSVTTEDQELCLGVIVV